MKNNLAESSHFVNILPPVDITGGKYSDVFSMSKYDHATILVQVGVSAAAFTKIIVNATDDFTPSNRTAIPFRMYACETSAGDTLGAASVVAATGYTPSANDNIMYVIEINADELPSGKPNLELNVTNTANSVIASAVAILTKGRYTGDQSATVLA
jgi:hypothetical protein